MALTTLAQAQAYLGVTTNPALMQSLIDALSARIESWLGRKIVSQSYSEIYQVPTSQLVLRQPDVTAIDFVAIETEDGLRIKYTGSDTDARVEVTDVSLKQVSRVGATTTTTTTTFAAQVTTAALVTAANLISGWTATLINSRPSAYLVRAGGVNVKDHEITLPVWKWYDGQYATDYLAGILDFSYNGWLSSGYGSTYGNQMRVDYTAGFATVPADVELTLWEMLRQAWDLKDVNTGLASETLGDYSYTLASQVHVDSQAIWVNRLSTFRRLTV